MSADNKTIDRLKAELATMTEHDRQNWKVLNKLRAVLGVPELQSVVEWAEKLVAELAASKAGTDGK